MIEQLIHEFADQLEEALEKSSDIQIGNVPEDIRNVLILGVGGSGIGGNIVQYLTAGEAEVPVTVSKNYEIPAFTNEYTLCIASSFSGNTEETLFSMKAALKRGAHVACLTSGGELLRIAEEKGLNYVRMRARAQCPRAHLGLSVVSLLFILEGYRIIPKQHLADVRKAVTLLRTEEDHIRKEASALAEKLSGKLPVLYSDTHLEAMLVRFRQQINENAKQICHTAVLPEMNHNELVGWVNPKELLNQAAVVFFRSSHDFERSIKRMEITKNIISERTSEVTEVFARGESPIEELFYFIHLCDWASYYLALKNGEDPYPVSVIDYLKNELSKVPTL